MGTGAGAAQVGPRPGCRSQVWMQKPGVDAEAKCGCDSPGSAT